MATGALGHRDTKTEHGIRFTDLQWIGLGQVVQRLDAVMAMTMTTQSPSGTHSIKRRLGQGMVPQPAVALHRGARHRPKGRAVDSVALFMAGFLYCGRGLMLEHLFEGGGDDENGSAGESDNYSSRSMTMMTRMTVQAASVTSRLSIAFMKGTASGLWTGHTPHFGAVIQWITYSRGHRKHTRLEQSSSASVIK